MDENTPPSLDPTPIDAPPVWVRMIQAVIIGVVAGLALNAVLSLTVLRGEAIIDPGAPPQKQCRKMPPPVPKESVAPRPDRPSTGQNRRTPDVQFTFRIESVSRVDDLWASTN